MELLDYNGVPTSSWVDYNTFKHAINYQPKHEDIFVAAFAKSGSTWIQYIVHEILNDCCEPPLVHEMWWNYGLVIEKIGFSKVDRDDGIKRHLKTHLPFNLVPYNEKAKYIYIVRNPWDSCVSGYNMVSQMPECSATYNSFDEWFDDCITGRIENGCYFAHVSSWISQRGKENILLLTYEETKRNTRESVLKIAKFLGDEYFTKLSSNEEKVQKLLKYVSFEYMKNLPFVCPTDVGKALKANKCDVGKNVDMALTNDYMKVDFFKSGKSGHSKQHFTEKQNEIIKQKINEHLKQFFELLNVWKEHGMEI